MSFLNDLTNRMGIAGDLLQFFWQRKWWWLTPMILMLHVHRRPGGVRTEFGDCAVYLYIILGPAVHKCFEEAGVTAQ